jgi:carboxymethylenebutenolidase
MGEITINAGGDWSFRAYVANQQGVRGRPGLLLIHEAHGLDQTMRELADDLSLNGYIVVCPDLFSRRKPGTRPDTPDGATLDKDLATFDADRAVDDLKLALEHMRAMQEINGKVGIIGYALGGQLAYLMMTRSTADAGVSYYAVGLERRLDTAFAITKPYMAHMAGQDCFVPPTAQNAIREAFGRNPNISLNLFEAQAHAFARVGGENWDRRAANAANELTAEFFRQYLV